MNCEKCQKETFLPFRCQYCGGHFCSEHRLPENHQCPQIDLARTPKEETQPIASQKQKKYEYSVTYSPTGKARNKLRFSNKEISHLTVAAFLVVGVGLSLFGFQNLLSSDYATLAMIITTLTISFFTHEIAHKIVAQRNGLWAEFRLTLMGAALTMLSIVSPIFKIISPGAVMISGLADAKSIGKISIAGPTTNISLATAFLSAALLTQQPATVSLLMIGAAFNAWIALFNLIPFGIFDGFKVFIWDKKIWAVAFTASLILTGISSGLLF
jgi:Zn-dependent protease